MLYISQVKREYYGHTNNEDAKQSQYTVDKEREIVEAIKYFRIIWLIYNFKISMF